jgi:predicted nucleic acid-binding Zn ribbon protein
MTAPPLSVCPQDRCAQQRWGRGKVKRLLGAGAGLLFKGSGFYVTDYRSDGYKQAAKQESAPATADTPKSGSGAAAKPGGDPKPATKGPPKAVKVSD